MLEVRRDWKRICRMLRVGWIVSGLECFEERVFSWVEYFFFFFGGEDFERRRKIWNRFN